jgi:hypothetical protein
MTSQHRLAAGAAVISLVVFGVGCKDEAQGNLQTAKAGAPDAGAKPPNTSKPPHDADGTDVPIATPDAAPDSSGTPPPPTTGAGGSTGTTPPPPPTIGPGGSTGTMPPPPAMVSLRIAAFGDFGVDNKDEADAAALVKSWSPDHVITLGDDNYPSGGADTIDKNIGKYFHEFIGGYQGSYGAGSASNRFWPSPGNHDWVATGLKPYTDYFTLPGNERYYDVDLGLVHLYAMDSDSHEPDGNTASSKQALWLKDKLAASKSCFDLVYFHHPPYSSGEHGSDADMTWPFEAWGAESVLAGHDHNYERFQVGGIPYFVVGTAGAGLRPFAGAALPETKFRNADTHGAMLIKATATGISFEYWTNDGRMLDSISVPKTCR